MHVNCDLRLIRATEAYLLAEFLYHAIWVPDGSAAPDMSIVRTPELARYYSDWGRAGDMAVVAVGHGGPESAPAGEQGDGGRGRRHASQSAQDSAAPHHHSILGAAWIRLFAADAPGYAFVAEDVPELSMSVRPEWRGGGVGTSLLRALISRATAVGHSAVSLSVDGRNKARHLYERFGFSPVTQSETLTMILRLK